MNTQGKHIDYLVVVINGLGWLYGHALIQALLFNGRDGFDFGLGTLLPGMLWGLVWAYLQRPILKKMFSDSRSADGLLFSNLFGSFIGFILCFLLASKYGIADTRILPPNSAAHFLSQAFHVLGGFGLIPEGRDRSASFHILMLAGIVLTHVGILIRKAVVANHWIERPAAR